MEKLSDPAYADAIMNPEGEAFARLVNDIAPGTVPGYD